MNTITIQKQFFEAVFDKKAWAIGRGKIQYKYIHTV